VGWLKNEKAFNFSPKRGGVGDVRSKAPRAFFIELRSNYIIKLKKMLKLKLLSLNFIMFGVRS